MRFKHEPFHYKHTVLMLSVFFALMTESFAHEVKIPLMPIEPDFMRNVSHTDYRHFFKQTVREFKEWLETVDD